MAGASSAHRCCCCCCCSGLRQALPRNSCRYSRRLLNRPARSPEPPTAHCLDEGPPPTAAAKPAAAGLRRPLLPRRRRRPSETTPPSSGRRLGSPRTCPRQLSQPLLAPATSKQKVQGSRTRRSRKHPWTKLQTQGRDRKQRRVNERTQQTNKGACWQLLDLQVREANARTVWAKANLCAACVCPWAAAF